MSDAGIRDVPEGEIAEGKGANDGVAPVKDAAVAREIDLMTVFDGLPERDRARFGKELIKIRPEVLIAAQKRRRDRIRLWLTVIVLASVIGEALVAMYLTQRNGISWDHMKDWLTLAVAPLAALLGAVGAFWFPSKELE